jgi:hypothetical protein
LLLIVKLGNYYPEAKNTAKMMANEEESVDIEGDIGGSIGGTSLVRLVFRALLSTAHMAQDE